MRRGFDHKLLPPYRITKEKKDDDKLDVEPEHPAPVSIYAGDPEKDKYGKVESLESADSQKTRRNGIYGKPTCLRGTHLLRRRSGNRRMNCIGRFQRQSCQKVIFRRFHDNDEARRMLLYLVISPPKNIMKRFRFVPQRLQVALANTQCAAEFGLAEHWRSFIPEICTIACFGSAGANLFYQGCN